MSKSSSDESRSCNHAGGIKTISVLGASGSVGDSALDIILGAPDRYRVNALTANRNVEKLAKRPLLPARVMLLLQMIAATMISRMPCPGMI